MEQLELQHDVFFDPFSQQEFDPAGSFDTLLQRYLDNEVEHDYTADAFVRDTEALLLDAEFVGQFAVAEAIAMQMHELCGDDHAVKDAFQSLTTDKHDHDSDHDHEADEVHDAAKCASCKSGKPCARARRK